MAPNEGDRIEVQFTETEALAQRLLDELEARLAQASAIGDELEVARLQAKRTAIQGGQYTRDAPAVQEDTAALERENAVRQRGLDIELQTLEVLRQQVAARLSLEGETIGSRGTVAAPPGTRIGGSYGQLAGQQVLAEQQAARQRALAEEQRYTQEMEQQAAAREAEMRRISELGYGSGARGQQISSGQRQALIAGPQGAGAERMGGVFTEDEQALRKYNLALGEYEGFASRAQGTSSALGAEMTRLGVVQQRESNAMRAHGALTTEWLAALARGETTVSEFGYQIGATVGKFAGWTAAAAGTFAVLGAVGEFGKGAIDASHGVGMLSRTIDNLNTDKAAQQIRDLSHETNVSVKDAGDAMFRFSRTFHDQSDAAEAARLGISVYKLDQVNLQDSVKTSTALHQQYGLSLQGLAGVYDMLAASQREYNARITDMVPLLSKSSGAVKNAGGDLTQLIQLGTVGLRLMPGLGGAQLGTAFYRGAATQAQQHAGDLANTFGLGKDINPLTGQMNFTQLLMDAIRESAHLNEPQRRQLAEDIFGRQYGGRTAAFFGPQAAQLLDQVTGRTRGPQGPITPGATRGSLEEELGRLLGTTRQELDQFVNGIQRLGSALAQTGALAPFGLLLKGAIGFMNGLEGLLGIFNELPGPMRDVLSTLVELRLLMLFISRTRFGSSVVPSGAAGFVSRIPGLRGTQAAQTRGELASGTRAALQEVEANIGRTTAQALTVSAQVAQLEQRRATFIAQAGVNGRMTAAELEESNRMSAKIVSLQRQQAELEAEQAAQEATRVGLNQQMVGLTASTRRLRMSDEEVAGLQNRVRPGGTTPGGLVLPAGVNAERELAGLETAGAAQAGLLGRARTVVSRAGSAVGGLGSRIGGFVQALDPLTVGLVALPFVYEAFQSAIDRQDKAMEAAHKALAGPIGSAQDLRNQAKALQGGAGQMPSAGADTSFHGVLSTLAKLPLAGVGHILGISSLQNLVNEQRGAEMAANAQELNSLGTFYDHAAAKFAEEAPALIKTEQGRHRMFALSQQLRARMERVLQSSGFSQAEIDKIYGSFSDNLQKEYQSLLQDPARRIGGGPGQQFATYAGLLAKPLETRLQGLDDRAKLFGTKGPDLSQAALAYAALINRSRNWMDSTELQKVASAQQNFVNAVNKNVQDLMHAATMAPTLGGQQSDLRSAIGVIDHQRQNIERAFQTAVDYAKQHHEGAAAIQKLQYAEQQMLNNLADLHKQVVDQLLQTVKAQSEVNTSEIQGISPEADIARAQSTLSGLRNQLSVARANGADAQTIAQLVSEINNQQTAILKQTVQNAQAVAQAQGQLAVASITGITPQADIQRAQAGVTAAENMLSFVQSHGLGQAAVLQAQAQVYDAQRSLNQAIQAENQRVDQDARAFIEAQAGYAESQTVDPIRQAREQLSADIQALSFIKPQDFRTYQEYQTALLQQKAKIGQDQRSVRQQLFDQDLATLQFELHTQRISDQQYLDGLQSLLRQKKLTLQERQNVLGLIFDITHQSAVDLNVGSIKMPTTYEVRAAIARVRAGGRGGVESISQTYVQAPTTNHVTMTVYVDSKKDPHLKVVSKALYEGLNQVSGQAQAAGVV